MASSSHRGNKTRPDPLAAELAEALTAHQQGQLDEAERRYHAILAKAPKHADALHFTGVLLLQRGQAAQGVEVIQAAIRIRPSAPMHSNIANGLIALGQHAAALQHLNRSLDLDPSDAAAHTNRGVALAGLNRHKEAIQSYQRALALTPGFLEALNNLGNSMRALGQNQESLSVYAQALTLNPRYAEALNNRGLALKALGLHDDAIASFDAALSIRPNYPEAWSNRGNALKEKGDFSAAHASYQQARTVRPDFVDAIFNEANTLVAENRLHEALQDYAAVLALRPEHADARWNTALTHLLLGEYEQAWADYHWRWKTPAAGAPRKFPYPAWSGREDLQGRSILLWAEQGLGDTIHFCRHALALAARGAHVTLSVQPELVGLLRSLSAQITVIASHEPAPRCDFHCALPDLPRVLGITLATIPAPIPYLSATPARLEAWHARMRGPSPRIGIVCSGNPRLVNDKNRSIPLQDFAPLLASGANFWLIQKDLREADATWLATETRITDLRADLADFDDTAAVLAHLDLLISVDTSVAHLAGAMGRPVWLLLPHTPDWRWLLDRPETPWYPGMRLYRQSHAGDWQSVLARVMVDLQARQSIRST